MAAGVQDGRAEVERTEEAALAVVPQANETVEGGDDELVSVGRVEEEGTDFGAPEGAVFGRAGGGGSSEGRKELSGRN